METAHQARTLLAPEGLSGVSDDDNLAHRTLKGADTRVSSQDEEPPLVVEPVDTAPRREVHPVCGDLPVLAWTRVLARPIRFRPRASLISSQDAFALLTSNRFS